MTTGERVVIVRSWDYLPLAGRSGVVLDAKYALNAETPFAVQIMLDQPILFAGGEFLDALWLRADYLVPLR